MGKSQDGHCCTVLCSVHCQPLLRRSIQKGIVLRLDPSPRRGERHLLRQRAVGDRFRELDKEVAPWAERHTSTGIPSANQ